MRTMMGVSLAAMADVAERFAAEHPDEDFHVGFQPQAAAEFVTAIRSLLADRASLAEWKKAAEDASTVLRPVSDERDSLKDVASAAHVWATTIDANRREWSMEGMRSIREAGRGLYDALNAAGYATDRPDLIATPEGVTGPSRA